ncbi:hypothetical protein [Pasteurella multocida]|uniref:hypothetical protein n=1 Tax=Pasteurella multocida TaxID=747 RepID=UPI0022FFD0E1|nr:hypothetical protein [Pasteurella multocida]MDA5611696.1 DUF4263 domain-containing protein [Pasteurella multocida]MDA5614182.1 DUF4263 domain-containing protein [Pasteurella multocida]
MCPTVILKNNHLDSIDDIEESYFYDITKQRLNIIKKFEELTNDNEKEKVIQKYLYQHLWLLDPSWERTTSETVIEKTLTQELKAIEPESTGARIDIAYKTVSGKYIIIEMKRPDVRTPLKPTFCKPAVKPPAPQNKSTASIIMFTLMYLFLLTY